MALYDAQSVGSAHVASLHNFVRATFMNIKRVVPFYANL